MKMMLFNLIPEVRPSVFPCPILTQKEIIYLFLHPKDLTGSYGITLDLEEDIPKQIIQLIDIRSDCIQRILTIINFLMKMKESINENYG